MSLESYLKSRSKMVDAALNQYVPMEKTRPATIHKAMRYSLFAGGKRMRPILTLAAAEACGGDLNTAMPPACAVECIHTYSLIHDDLPCMDDDDLRRGRPTSHKVFGEGMAVLAGDALLTQAFIILASVKPHGRYPLQLMLQELSHAAGSLGLIAGQVADLEGEGKKLSLDQLKFIHLNKTSALITASIRLGAMAANASSQNLKHLTVFGRNLGLAFQIIDDILDATQSSEILGKTAGKDQKANKATYPSLMGLEKARLEAHRVTKLALNALKNLGKNGSRLQELGEYLLVREY